MRGRSIPFRPTHGVTGETRGSKTSLSNETVTFQNSGILAELCHCLGEQSGASQYLLTDLLYNLPYIHRAYKLTYGSRPELFVPIVNPLFVRKESSTEAWFSAEIQDERYANQYTVKKLGSAFEHDQGVFDKFVIRLKTRFGLALW